LGTSYIPLSSKKMYEPEGRCCTLCKTIDDGQENNVNKIVGYSILQQHFIKQFPVFRY